MGILDGLRKTQGVAPATAPALAPQAAAPASRPGPALARPAQAARPSPYGNLHNAKDAFTRLDSVLGTHVLEVIQCRDGYLEKHAGGDFFFAVDFKVVESTDPNLKPGSERSWMTTLGRYPEYFERDVAGFLMGVLGCTKDQLEPAEGELTVAEQATSEINALMGRFVMAEVFADPKGKINPKTNQVFNRVQFMPLPTDQAA